MRGAAVPFLVFETPSSKSFPWSVSLLLSGAYAVAFVDRALVAVAGAPIKHDLALSDTQFGLLQGMAFVPLFAVAGVPLGWLADRVDRRMMIALGLVFWSAMTAVCGLAGGFGLFFLARVGVGLGEACLLPAGMSLIGDVATRANVARASAIFLMGAATGNAMALLSGGYLLDALEQAGGAGGFAPWRALFLVAVAPGLAMALAFLTLREPTRSAPRRSSRAEAGAALRHLARFRSAYGWLSLATACNVALAQTQAAWMPLFLVRKFGFTPGAAAVTVGLLFLATAPAGQAVGGVVIDRLRARGVGGPSCVMLALATGLSCPLALAFGLADRFAAAAAAYAAFNFVVSAATPAGLTGWHMLTPERSRGLTVALLTALVTLPGVGLGPAAVGYLTDRVFADPAALGRALASVCMAAGALGCGVACFGRPSLARAIDALQPRVAPARAASAVQPLLGA